MVNTTGSKALEFSTLDLVFSVEKIQTHGSQSLIFDDSLTVPETPMELIFIERYKGDMDFHGSSALEKTESQKLVFTPIQTAVVNGTNTIVTSTSVSFVDRVAHDAQTFQRSGTGSGYASVHDDYRRSADGEALEFVTKELLNIDIKRTAQKYLVTNTRYGSIGRTSDKLIYGSE
eukprot:Awhi_evm1s7475